jgi:hypothetical protein
MPSKKHSTTTSNEAFVSLSKEFKRAASLGLTKRAKVLLMNLLRLHRTDKEEIPKDIIETYQKIEEQSKR